MSPKNEKKPKKMMMKIVVFLLLCNRCARESQHCGTPTRNERAREEDARASPELPRVASVSQTLRSTANKSVASGIWYCGSVSTGGERARRAACPAHLGG
jgi:hypothetical protein